MEYLTSRASNDDDDDDHDDMTNDTFTSVLDICCRTPVSSCCDPFTMAPEFSTNTNRIRLDVTVYFSFLLFHNF